MESDLLEYVLAGLASCGESIPQVAAGAGVKVRWLRYVAAGQTKNPGVRRLEQVARYLKTRHKRAA